MQSRLYCGVSTLIAVIVLFSSIHRSEAATFDIANGDVTALVNTIATCNSNNEDDTINLAANGTYFLTRVDNSTHGPSGLPVIVNDNFHSVTINGNNSRIIRDGNSAAFRIITINNPLGNVAFNVSINNVTITGGLGATSGGEAVLGGGVCNVGATLMLTRCTVSSNFAGTGGGIFNQDAIVSLVSCTISGNSATTGGAISNHSTLASTQGGHIFIATCTLSGNSVTSLAGAAISNLRVPIPVVIRELT